MDKNIWLCEKMWVIKWIDKMNVLSSKNYSKIEWLIISDDTDHIWSEWKWKNGRMNDEIKTEVRKKELGEKW